MNPTSTTGNPVRLKQKILFSRPKSAVVQHLLCWALYIIYEVGSVRIMGHRLEPLYVYVIYYTINIGLFYAVVAALNSSISPGGLHWLKVLTRILLIFAGYLLIKLTADFFLSKAQASVSAQLRYIQTFFPSNIFRGLQFFLLAVLYWSPRRIIQFQQQASESENRQLQAQREKAEFSAALATVENARLRMQLNPHILFNTLNSIYSNVYTISPQSARAVWLLSDLMRFSLDATSSEEKVLLSDELNQLRQLAEMNALRYEGTQYLDIHVEGNTDNYRIIPLVLLTLTENVIKHGNLLDGNDPGVVRIKIDPAGRLTYYSRNLKKAISPYKRTSTFGLKSVRLRLEHDYPGRHELITTDSPNHFELQLDIPL